MMKLKSSEKLKTLLDTRSNHCLQDQVWAISWITNLKDNCHGLQQTLSDTLNLAGIQNQKQRERERIASQSRAFEPGSQIQIEFHSRYPGQ